MICVNDKHPLKAPFSIEVIVDGIAICVNDEQSLNAQSPIEVTE